MRWIVKNWGKIASSSCPAQPFRTKWGSIAKNWGKIASSSSPVQPFRTKWGSIAKNWGKIASSSRPAQPFRTKWGSIVADLGPVGVVLGTCYGGILATPRVGGWGGPGSPLAVERAVVDFEYMFNFQ